MNPTVGGFYAGNQLVIGNVFDFETTGNLVEGNVIGLGASGQAESARTPGELGRLYIAFDDSSSRNATSVGGTASGAGNLISGNTEYGIYINDSGNLVEGNLIGTDPTGTVRSGNGTPGTGRYIDGHPEQYRRTRSAARPLARPT